MANVRSGNTWYIDTVDTSLSGRNIALMGIIISADGGAAHMILGDDVSAAGYPTKLHYHIASGSSVHLDFNQCPIMFPNGIRVVGLTNAHATLIIRIPGESS